jgi:hypothetical protein
MPPLHFSDEEKDLLLTLAQPIDQRRRTEFLQAVAAELEASGQAGAIGIGCIGSLRRFKGGSGSRPISAKANTDVPKGGGSGVSGSGRAPSGRASRSGSVADPSGRASSGALARLGGRR